MCSNVSRPSKIYRRFRSDTILTWLNILLKENLLRLHPSSQTESLYSLKPPLHITMKSAVVLKLKKRYRSGREMGGILLAEPFKSDSSNSLLINRVRFIRNISKDDGKYQARGDQIEHMHKCLVGTKKGNRYLPVWFHSHPTKSKDLNDVVMAYFGMTVSEGDKTLATRRITYRSDTKHITLALPSALLLVTYEGELFIGFHGGYIAPEDFREYIRALLGKTAKDIFEWGFEGESVWRKIAGLLGSFAVGIASAGTSVTDPLLTGLANQIAIIRKQMDGDPNYFSTTKEDDLKIIIPVSGQP